MIATTLRAAALIIGLALSQLVPISAAAAQTGLRQCTELALGGSSLSLPVASPVKPSPDGAIFPILFVHGFSDTSDTWTRPAAVTWADTPNVPDPQSFVDWTSVIPGAMPVLFDYGDKSLEWVTNPAIGPALADVVNCIASAAAEKVAIVAHSMGGLAARYALADPQRAAQVSTVVTLGTPNLGAFGPIVLGNAARDAAALDRWIRLSHASDTAGSKAAFSAAYRAAQTFIHNCESRIERTPAAGICGDITPIVGAMRSRAGTALAAGSQQLSDLPPWPDGVDVFALATNYTGFDTDEWLGDIIVYPGSAIAHADDSHALTCQLGNRPWLGDLGPRRNGCWHPDQPANQDLIAFALSQLRQDVDARSQSPIDWQNTSYALTCAGLAPEGMDVTLVNGTGTVPGAGGYDEITVTVSATATGDVTDDGAPETAVLLFCAPRPSNFFVEDVQVFSLNGSLLDELPNAETLDPQGILPPEYVPEELVIEGGVLVAGMRFYATGDSHADGPSEPRTLEWQWNGNSFDVVADSRSAPYTSHAVERFGFRTEVPTGFSIVSASDNSDGLTLQNTEDNRVEVSIYGANNVSGESPEQLRDSYVADAHANGSVVTYQNVTGNAVTVTGQTAGAEIFYIHLVVGPGSSNAIYWTYPASEKAAYDEAVTHSVRSLQVGDLTQPH